MYSINNNFKLMKNIVSILTLSFLALSFLSCEEDHESNLSFGNANLTVTVVRGSDHSKVIKYKNVFVYISELDADEQVHDIAVAGSDQLGVAQFNGLESGRTYWLRADNVIGKSIRDVTVNSGNNSLILPLWR